MIGAGHFSTAYWGNTSCSSFIYELTCRARMKSKHYEVDTDV